MATRCTRAPRVCLVGPARMRAAAVQPQREQLLVRVRLAIESRIPTFRLDDGRLHCPAPLRLALPRPWWSPNGSWHSRTDSPAPVVIVSWYSSRVLSISRYRWCHSPRARNHSQPVLSETNGSPLPPRLA